MRPLGRGCLPERYDDARCELRVTRNQRIDKVTHQKRENLTARSLLPPLHFLTRDFCKAEIRKFPGAICFDNLEFVRE